MNEYTFWIPIHGVGSTTEAAWEHALAALMDAVLRSKEWGMPPADIFTTDDPIPAAEILGGSLSAGFGIDHGPEQDPSFHHFNDGE